ncbi:unnamed protein product [Mytilus edulis]|uniref:Uncharacterized protein n=1 Tax=Mytilus edulis TaxID=6550 RepID=A0A8S3T425_MYTED|nr:unnamed protein product [Mytilus edulis]
MTVSIKSKIYYIWPLHNRSPKPKTELASMSYLPIHSKSLLNWIFFWNWKKKFSRPKRGRHYICWDNQLSLVNGEDLRNVSHNEAVQVFLKAEKLKEFELLDKELNLKAKEAAENSRSSRIWTALGVSVVVIAGSLFLAKKYNKLPDLLNIKLPSSWSS